jgi:RNA polymerase sigma-70 factor (ECF subfamily)
MSIPDPESSFELLRRVRTGDVTALDRLMVRHLGPLRKWARGRLPRWARDFTDTQDLVQEALLHTLKHLQTFQPQREGALQAYLRQAVANRIKDEVRKRKRRPEAQTLEESVPSDLPSPLSEAIGQEMVDRYEAALAELRDDEREAIIARVELGQSYEEVAALLGRPTPDAARVAVQRALVKLAAKMKPAERQKI